MKAGISKGLPKMLPFAVGGLIAGFGAVNIGYAANSIVNKAIEKNHADIWRQSRAEAEAFWDGFEDGMKDADRYL